MSYLNRLIIACLLACSFASFAQEDICLYDSNNDGEFAGGAEINECGVGYTVYGAEIGSCPNGQVTCNTVAGIPVCPTDPSYPCVQADTTSPFTCSSVPPRNTIPPELSIEYDFDDVAYIISNPAVDREACVVPVIETCELVPVTCTNPLDPYCPSPSKCVKTETWNPVTKMYDVTLGACNDAPACYDSTETDPVTGIVTNIVVCPQAAPCDIDTPVVANVCPLDDSTVCTSAFTGSSATSCSPLPEVVPPPCRLEFDQDDGAHIVCDERQATCQLDEGRFHCPFNNSASACTRPDESSPYQCYVDEVTCQATPGNTQTTPVNVDPFPTGSDSGPLEDDGSCTGEIRVFHGEPFSCLQAGVRSRWDNCCNNGNNVIDEAMNNYWDGVNTMQEGVADMAGLDFLGDIVTKLVENSPAYIIEDEIASLGNWLLTPCADDSITSSMIATGRCVTVGTRCVESLFGTCLQDKQIECCFASKLARIINEQGRPQLGIGWGTPENPDCRGLSLAEFQSIDFSQLDLSEYISDLEVKSKATMDAEMNSHFSDDILRIGGS